MVRTTHGSLAGLLKRSGGLVEVRAPNVVEEGGSAVFVGGRQWIVRGLRDGDMQWQVSFRQVAEGREIRPSKPATGPHNRAAAQALKSHLKKVPYEESRLPDLVRA